MDSASTGGETMPNYYVCYVQKRKKKITYFTQMVYK